MGCCTRPLNRRACWITLLHPSGVASPETAHFRASGGPKPGQRGEVFLTPAPRLRGHGLDMGRTRAFARHGGVRQVDWIPLDRVASIGKHRARAVAPVGSGQRQLEGMCSSMGHGQSRGQSMLRLQCHAWRNGPQAAHPMVRTEGAIPAGVGQYLGKMAGYCRVVSVAVPATTAHPSHRH